MARHEDMMTLKVETRRAYFHKVYTAELARLHATGKCMWPIENLGKMADGVMTGILARRAPIGPAYDATMKFFGLKTQKALFAFLEAA
jgi:hypothetical protein